MATTSMTPLVARRLATRPRPCVSRYSASAAPGVSARQGISGPTSSASAGFPSSSTTSTRSPRSIAARAKTAVTVVFPTPPLPATMTTWASVRNCSGFTLFGGTCAQASHHHSHRAPCRAGGSVAVVTVRTCIDTGRHSPDTANDDGSRRVAARAGRRAAGVGDLRQDRRSLHRGGHRQRRVQRCRSIDPAAHQPRRGGVGRRDDVAAAARQPMPRCRSESGSGRRGRRARTVCPRS